MTYLAALGPADVSTEGYLAVLLVTYRCVTGPALLPLASMCKSSIRPLFHSSSASRIWFTNIYPAPYFYVTTWGAPSALCMSTVLHLSTMYHLFAPITTHLLCYQGTLYGSLLSACTHLVFTLSYKRSSLISHALEQNSQNPFLPLRCSITHAFFSM